jgi:hypothetical protein
MRGLPHAFHSVEASEGTLIQVDVMGEAGGSWFLERTHDSWKLAAPAPSPQATLRIDQELAWRVFTKGVAPKEAQQHVEISGDRSLALRVLSLVAVLA